MAQQRSMQDFVGHKLLDSEGHSIGKIERVFIDDKTSQPKWVTVQTGMLNSKTSFVPLQGAQPQEEDLTVPYDKDTVKDAPHFESERHLSADEEDELFRHYGVSVPSAREEQAPGTSGRGRHEAEAGMAAGTGTGHDTGQNMRTSGTEEDIRTDVGPGSDTGMRPGGNEDMASGTGMRSDEGMDERASDDLSMTRHEEQANIGVEREEAGRAHIHKSVETEHFERDVPVAHDELRVERMPLTDEERRAHAEGEYQEEDEEVLLYGERATVSKESVPVEKVRVTKEEVTDSQRVEGDVRKERIEVEDEEGWDAQQSDAPRHRRGEPDM